MTPNQLDACIDAYASAAACRRDVAEAEVERIIVLIEGARRGGRLTALAKGYRLARSSGETREPWSVFYARWIAGQCADAGREASSGQSATGGDGVGAEQHREDDHPEGSEPQQHPGGRHGDGLVATGMTGSRPPCGGG